MRPWDQEIQYHCFDVDSVLSQLMPFDNLDFPTSMVDIDNR